MGDESIADEPVWVEDGQGKKLRILWPNGFVARFEPNVVLVDQGGAIVARSGDVLDLAGGQVDPAFDFFACQITNKTNSP
jgi:hypothetical protein